MSEEIKVGDWVQIISGSIPDDFKKNYIEECEGMIFQVEKVEAETVTVNSQDTDLFPKECIQKVYVSETPPPEIAIEPCDDWQEQDIIYRIEEVLPNIKRVTAARPFEILGGHTYKECVMKAIEYGWHNLSRENRNLKVALSKIPPPETGSHINVDDLLDYIKPDNGDDYMVSHSELSDQINTFSANNGVSLPQVTQTEVEIKSGHMAGYGKEEYILNISPDGEYTAYHNKTKKMFFHIDGKWEYIENIDILPHEQEDLKHHFKIKP